MSGAIFIVLTLLLLMAVGFLCGKLKMIGEEQADFLSKLVVRVAMPGVMISNLTEYFAGDTLRSAGSALIIPFCTISAGYGIAYLLAKAIKLPRQRVGLFCAMFAFSNTVFIGLPVTRALFGEPGVPFALFYFFGNTMLFWTGGSYFMQLDAQKEKVPFFSKATLVRIASPALISFFIGMALVLLRVPVPGFLLNACKYLGSLSTPLSMLYIGYMIYSIGLKNLKPTLSMVCVLAGRVIVVPAITLLLVLGTSLDPLVKGTLVMQASMPVMSQIPIIARAYGGDGAFAAQTAMASTLLSMIVIPIYMLIFPLLGLG